MGSGLPQPADKVFFLFGIVYRHHDVPDSIFRVAAVAIERDVKLQDYLPHQCLHQFSSALGRSHAGTSYPQDAANADAVGKHVAGTLSEPMRSTP